MSATHAVVFVPDCHGLFVDHKALKLACALISDVQPRAVYQLGDLVDFQQISAFDKNPGRLLDLQLDIDAGASILRQLREAAPKAELHLVEGNHEERLTRYLWKHPEISALRALTLPELLGLRDLRVNFHPASTTCEHSGFIVTHGDIVRKWGGYAAHGQFDKYGASGISGHTHRTGVFRTHKYNSEFAWYEAGCLCTTSPEYVTGRPDWHQGLAVGYFSDHRFQIDLINIVRQQFMYKGQLYK